MLLTIQTFARGIKSTRCTHDFSPNASWWTNSKCNLGYEIKFEGNTYFSLPFYLYIFHFFFELWKPEEPQGKGCRFLRNDEHPLLGTSRSLCWLPALICLPHSHGEMLVTCMREGEFQTRRPVKTKLGSIPKKQLQEYEILACLDLNNNNNNKTFKYEGLDQESSK